MNVKSWVDAVKFNLVDIGITTVSQIQKGVMTLNIRLDNQGHAMLHTRTLVVFANVAEKNFEEWMSYK
jgi:hypothetical protein